MASEFPAARPPEDGASLPSSVSSAEDGDLEALLRELARTRDPKLPTLARPVRSGDKVGRFELLAEIGRGGFGAVFEARDSELGRHVALKVLLHAWLLGDPRIREHLRREAEAVARLHHPNIITLFDYGVHEGVPYLVLELLLGETLQRRQQRDPPSFDQALKIVRGMAAGMVHAHAAGVVHRDIKPGNVFLTVEGGVKLLDFGLARVRGAIEQLSNAGTPAYLAPERQKGAPGDVRGDVYSAGVVLSSLFGRRPPRALAGIVARATAEEPAERTASAELLLAELDAVADARARRERWSWAAAATVVLGGLAAALVLLRPHAPPPPPVWQPVLVDHLPLYEENSDAPMISPDGRSVTFVSNRDGALRLYVAPLGAGPSRVVGSPTGVYRPNWSSDGKSLIYMVGTTAYRVGLDGGAPEKLIEVVSDLAACGDQIAFNRRFSSEGPHFDRLMVRSADGVERDRASVPPDERITSMRCDRAGARLVYGVTASGSDLLPPSDLWLLEVAGDAPPRRLTTDHPAIDLAVFAVDGRSLIFGATRDGHTNLVEMALGGGPLVPITSDGGPNLAPDLSPDGETLIFDVDTSAALLFARGVADGSRRTVTQTLDEVMRPPAVSLDGSEVIVGMKRRGRGEILAYPARGGPERLLAEGWAPTISPDDTDVLFATHGPRSSTVLSMPRGGGPTRTLGEVPGKVQRLRGGPDGILHVRTTTDEGWQAWRLPLAGGVAERDAPAPWSFVFPAPRGGWRLGSRDGTYLIPPGVAVDRADAPGVVRLTKFPVPVSWDSDGRSFVYYWNVSEVRRRFVETGQEVVLLRDVDDVDSLAISADGQTVYLIQTVGHVRRRLITNFATRTRPSPL